MIKDSFDRSIIGYDIRKRPFPLKGEDVVITIDMERWKDFDKKYSCMELNGLNLLYSDSQFLDDDFCLVAFDIPSEIARKLSVTFGLKPFSFNKHIDSKEWIFIGFDIVDIYTQVSILYSFDGTISNKLNKILRSKHIILNKYGILQDQLESIELSQVANELVPQHAPFIPCGIWLKKHNI